MIEYMKRAKIYVAHKTQLPVPIYDQQISLIAEKFCQVVSFPYLLKNNPFLLPLFLSPALRMNNLNVSTIVSL